MEEESEEDSSGDKTSTNRRRITSAVDESLKKGVSSLPLEVVAVRRFRFWETSVRLFSENDEWMPATVEEEWRQAGAPLTVRCLFLGPARIIFQRIRESEPSEEKSDEIGYEGMDRTS